MTEPTTTNSQPDGYLALPPSGDGPGVLVLHAWWGLSDAIKDVCDRLAAEGFVAYAPDLFHGQTASTVEEAQALVDQHESGSSAGQVSADVAAATDRLWERVQTREGGLGVVGFSFGAYYALKLSGDDPQRVRAVVLFYGSGEGDFGRATAAYLGHYAENDPYEPAEYVDGLEATIRAAGRPVTFHRYPGIGHWFFEPDRPDAYNAAAAQLAWERTVAFLKETL
jgi:carboxymethylenebutenolidase